jgi:hypothetical protein
VFWNPFRKVWVYSIRHVYKVGDAVDKSYGFPRKRSYQEGPDLLAAARWEVNEPLRWTDVDRLDPLRDDLRFADHQGRHQTDDVGAGQREADADAAPRVVQRQLAADDPLLSRSSSARRLMVWQPRGILDESHVEQLISLLEHTEDEAERPFNRYTDLSRLDAVELTFKYVLEVSLYRRLVYGARSIVKSAFYAVDRATAQLALTHATVSADSSLKVKVFLRKSSAAKWLGSASSRALRAASSSRPFVTMARLARVIVSSSWTRMSPAFTRSPSWTLSLPTTPPVGCWTFFTFESTTTEPCAIRAPAI